LPSKGISRPLIPELIELQALLTALGITRLQLVDLAILVGTDFNKGVQGVGPKTALKLVKEYERLERLPDKFKTQLPDNVEAIRNIFLHPDVREDYEIQFKGVDEAGLTKFLCEERGFSPDRVNLAIERMHAFYGRDRSTLRGWLGNQEGA
jgi:flap endonuclease-1